MAARPDRSTAGFMPSLARHSSGPFAEEEGEVADWESPTLLERGRLGAHAPLRCYESPAQALDGLAPGDDTTQQTSSNVLPLTPGRWRFLYVPSVEIAPTPSGRHGGFNRAAEVRLCRTARPGSSISPGSLLCPTS
ncbi:hypothetical protein T492DRAFT_387413 [Pavlovales sp. CCMP2436]|nr:hypothetical protein T492DRAFT_387413 [Pavlovales sp. CCMP2436]